MMPLNDLTPQAYAVHLAQQMLRKQLSFFEGAVRMAPLRHDIEGVDAMDEDFLAFVLISSETDHLPLKAHQHLWSPESLAQLLPEIEHVEIWASPFATQACENIIQRFSSSIVADGTKKPDQN